MNYFIILIIFLITNCSFDKKSGIWEDENNITKENEKLFKDFKIITQDSNSFDQTVPLKKKFHFFINKPIKNSFWLDSFYSNQNKFINFRYDDNKKVLLKGKKISRYKLNKEIFFINGLSILSDEKGNVIIFSNYENEIVDKFNFYKNKYKRIKKKLNLIVEKNTIYISDNLGFLYAYDFTKRSIIWAKNYKIPFKSNLKILNNSLVVANQNNNIFFIDKNNGEQIKTFPTEETLFKNDFINNLATDGKNVFFLNSYGSLYAINDKKLLIWFRNFNKSFDVNPSNLFNGQEIIIHQNKIIISTNKDLYVVNALNGSTIFKKNINTSINPIVISKYIFLISKNNYLISINIENGEIIYSQNLNDIDFTLLNISKKELKPKKFMLINNQLFIFFDNSYFLKFDIYGELIGTSKLPSKNTTNTILVDGAFIYADKKNKIFIFN
tara:strand:+ start:4343 stop:5662 length:1320 start_codon:yes stop_codon:yes gene_type:complete